MLGIYEMTLSSDKTNTADIIFFLKSHLLSIFSADSNLPFADFGQLAAKAENYIRARHDIIERFLSLLF